ncbi:MAG: dienelactone hydrolase family protein, partial [Planctomycetaceae bacterium]|nr:dienelactone hydrolase family protein [Planctomycetaceae bacterium]
MGVAAVSSPAQEKLRDHGVPSVLSKAFSVPDPFRNDFGDYRSPLIFADGRRVKDAADWEQRRQEIRREWTELLGEWPPLITQPETEILQSEPRENFVQHTIRFRWLPPRKVSANKTESQPSSSERAAATTTQSEAAGRYPESVEFTTGYLLIPAADGPHPAVVTVFYEPETAIGHNNPHRDFALQLARRGFVTLSIGTTEASQAQTYALYYPEIGAADVQPLSMLGYAAANAWHVLANRPEVDADRIGIIGHSFGGKWAMFAGCLFDRFAAVAVSDPGIMFDTHPSVNYWEPW